MPRLSDQKAAIVADVATGINPDGSLSVLEEGVGQPTLMYVILPDEPYSLQQPALPTATMNLKSRRSSA